jgi:hypothetical protein
MYESMAMQKVSSNSIIPCIPFHTHFKVDREIARVEREKDKIRELTEEEKTERERNMEDEELCQCDKCKARRAKIAKAKKEEKGMDNMDWASTYSTN